MCKHCGMPKLGHWVNDDDQALCYSGLLPNPELFMESISTVEYEEEDPADED